MEDIQHKNRVRRVLKGKVEVQIDSLLMKETGSVAVRGGGGGEKKKKRGSLKKKDKNTESKQK
jgi:hypothetical protein